MAIKVDMTSADLDRQIELLKFYPEIMKKHFRPALFAAVRGLANQIRPTIPKGKTGLAQSTFGSKVTGTGVNLTGRVGWYDSSDPWYPNVLEYGAKPHEINSFAPGAGVYIKNHPGLSAIGFMAAGYSAREAQIDASMAAASEAVVNDLKVP